MKDIYTHTHTHTHTNTQNVASIYLTVTPQKQEGVPFSIFSSSFIEI